MVRFYPAVFVVTLFSTAALAGIQMDGTRVIYPAARKEVTLGINNHADTPRLIQAWMDNGDPDVQPGTDVVPFIVNPPIFRLDPGKGHSLRIHYTGGTLPQDRESVFWLNVLEINARPGVETRESHSRIAFPVRSRLKVFYRPAGLPGSPKAAVGQLRWQAVAGGVECDNPSAWNVSFNQVALKGTPVSEDTPTGMCPAKGKATFGVKTPPGGTLALSSINDYGGYDASEANYTVN